MKYSDYVNLKLQNFSKDELTNFSINQINFGDTTGYIPRESENLNKKRSGDRRRQNNLGPKPMNETQKALSSASKSAVDSLSKQQSSSSKSNSFDEKASLKSTTPNQQKNSNVSTNKATSQQNKQSTTQTSGTKSESKPESKSEVKTETKQAETSPSTTVTTQPKQDTPKESTTTETNKTESATSNDNDKVEESRTVKNWHGANVEFEKRGGKWYRKGTQEEVTKDGKWRSYFDEKNGVKDVRPGNQNKGTNSGTNTGAKKVATKQSTGKSNVDTKNVTLDPKLVEAAKNMKGKDQSDIDAEVKRFMSGQISQLKLWLDSKMINQAEYNDRIKLTNERAKLYRAELEKNLK